MRTRTMAEATEPSTWRLLGLATLLAAACSPAGPALGDYPGAHTPQSGATAPASAAAPAGAGDAGVLPGKATAKPASAAAAPRATPSAPPAASGPCPAGMVLLPSRQIEEWRASPTEKRMFKLDCKKRPRSCHQPAQTIDAFCIDRTEVTVAQYRGCIAAGRCTDAHLECGQDATFRAAGREQHPINCVDYTQAQAFCRAQGKQLPSREQYGWAQSNGRYDSMGHLSPPWGGRYPNDTEIWASIGSTPRAGTGPVSATPAGNTKQGVADLFGNVREWVRQDPADPGSRPAVMGYSYATTRSTPIGAGAHTPVDATMYNATIGFRCVATPRP